MIDWGNPKGGALSSLAQGPKMDDNKGGSRISLCLVNNLYRYNCFCYIHVKPWDVLIVCFSLGTTIST